MAMCLSCARIGKFQKDCKKCAKLKPLTLYQKTENAKRSLSEFSASYREELNTRLVKTMIKLGSVAQ